jgi:RNA polymerase sigma-70 factor, ECF subfamily
MHTDRELLSRHVAGDSQAFGVLYARHQDKLRAVAAKIAGQEAEDALQEGMLKAHQRAAQFRGESQVSTWLHTIVKRAALDIVRRRHNTAEVSTDLDETNLPGTTPNRFGWHELRRVTAKVLTREQRQAMLLVDVMCYPVAEAAGILGVAEGTIKSRALRGRLAMAEALEGMAA